MKRILTAIAVAATVGAAGVASAAFVNGNPVDIEVVAAINSTLDITLGSSTTFDFGTVASGYQGIASFTLTNTGQGLTETFELQAAATATPGPWALGVAAGSDTYALYAKFATASPGIAGFLAGDRLTGALQTAGSSPAGTFASAGQDAVNTARFETVNLWVRFDAPSSSSVATAQHMKVTVTAIAP